MATTKFRFFVSTGGIPATTLTPIWSSCYDGSDAAVTGASRPVITEIGGGFYSFDVDLTTTLGIFGIIDCGDAIPNPYERYVQVSAMPGLDVVADQVDDLHKLAMNKRVTTRGVAGTDVTYEVDGVTAFKRFTVTDSGVGTTRTPA